jgi:hypothetical protein
MNREDVGQDREIGELAPVQVTPEELPTGEQPLDRFTAEVQRGPCRLGRRRGTLTTARHPHRLCACA